MEQIAKHTPGPWVVKENGEIRPSMRVGRSIGYAPLAKTMSDKRIHTACEKEANGRLIAAAPELLDELCRMVEIAEEAMLIANSEGSEYGAEYNVHGILAGPRAAISKAIGA